MKNKTYRHKSRQGSYTLLFIANEGATKPGWEPQAVYVSHRDGAIWARPLKEFLDVMEEL